MSLKSGAAVLAALQRSGVDAHGFDPAVQDLHTLLDEGYQRAFIALHGRYGEDGTVQGALELMGIPYTGSGVLASALAMDKWRTKLVWQAAGLPVPAYELLTADSDFDAVAARLGLPLFVKPANEGSSVGISKVKHAGELRAAYEEAAKHDKLVIVEAFVGGGEYTAAILGGQALPVIKIEPANEFYDYEAKYLRDDTRYLCPCGLAPEQEAEMQQSGATGICLDRRRGLGAGGFPDGRGGQALSAGNQYFARHDRPQPGADGGTTGRNEFRTTGVARIGAGPCGITRKRCANWRTRCSASACCWCCLARCITRYICRCFR